MADETPDTLAGAGQPAQPTLQDVINKAVADALAAAQPDRDPTIPVPKVDHTPETPEEVQDLAKMFAEYRAEVAALRQELQSHRPRVITVAGPQETVEQRQEARLAAIAENSFYCPLCGTLSKYARLCTGPDPLHPSHKAFEMVSTDELGGDPAKHTKAPSTDPDHPDLIAA
jgi:hypothetical protein